ncbi:MAG: thioredoxin family protein, partial [Gammaproteobacteria bacterium]|nr:thioredoxin family protein [Gammaproteobacteria bacterium]
KLLDHPMPSLNANLPQHPDGIVLFFHHPRCTPCKPVAKQIDHIIVTTPERVLKINVEEEPGLTQAFGIRTTPTTLFIKNNSVKAAFIGVVSPKKLQALLKPEP